MNLAVATAALVLAAVPPTIEVPIDVVPAAPAPVLEAEAYALYDLDAEMELLNHNADEQRAMASVTKLMTALVTLENASLADEVVISESAAGTGEAEVGLVAGETWTVWELLNAIIVRSGNDAATALAEYVGGSVEGFAELMNAKAADLGMAGTNFVNPHGLDADGHYSTANDLVLLGLAAHSDPVVARLARTRVVKFRPAPSGEVRRITNTNELLGSFDGVVGLKTGYTGDAGRVLVSTARREGRTLVAVVMGTEDHFADSRELLEFGFDMYGISDRIAGLGAGEQGGGSPSVLDPRETARLRAMPELQAIDVSARTTQTPLEARVTAALGSLLPPLLDNA